MSTTGRLRKRFLLFTIITLFFCTATNAQSTAIPKPATGNTPSPEKQRAAELLRKNLRLTGLTQAELSNATVTDAYRDKKTGDLIVYLQQGYLGIPVYNKIGVYIFRKDSLAEKQPNLIPHLIAKIPTRSISGGKARFNLSSDDAAKLAANHLSIPLGGSSLALGGRFSRVRRNDLVWLQVNNSPEVKLCWNVRISTDDRSNDWFVRVDAQTGEVLEKSSLIVGERDNPGTNDCIDEPAAITGFILPEAAVPTNPIAPTTPSTNTGPQTLNSPNANSPQTLNFAPATGATPQTLNRTTAATRPATPATPSAALPGSVSSSSYLVYPFPLESANFGSRSVDTDPWTKAGAANNATSLGWHFDNNATYTYTRGNNVWAQQDLAGNNTTTGFTDTSTTAAPTLTFNRSVDPSAAPTSYSNIRAGLDNLFYWNNLMHDISYQYGFDEPAGNFQAYNQGRGGLGTDYVDAFSLDGAGINNSDFNTPPDGENPVMRMFQWNYTVTTILQTNSPITQTYTTAESAVSFKNKLSTVGPITADIVQVNDPAGTHAGCGSYTNAASISGKIAMIDRGGGCNFTVKIKNAQSAGAIGVIVVNNVSGTPLTMTGNDTTITIPALMISLTDGNTLKSNLTGLNGTLSGAGQYTDGSFDNGVIAHEYTHGISNRLTGGPANADCLYNAEQMGEGWSDYMALMVTTDWSTTVSTDGTKKRTLGSYVLGQPSTGPGIRRYPYSTDLSVNPWRYDSLANNTANGEAHYIGEIWCATLWDMTWNIIQQEGIDADLYHGIKGNNIALQLVMQGLKYQPCGPGFIDGRDAILKADSLLYNSAHKCAIWNAFTRRGMGKSASQGSAYSYTDQTPAYDLPSGVSLSQTVNKTTPVNGDNVIYTITASCNCTPATGLSIVDTLSSNLTYSTSSGGTYTAPYVHFDGIDLAAGETKTFTVQATVTGGFAVPTTLINDGLDPANYTWTKTITSGVNSWNSSSTRAHTGANAWYATDAANTSDLALQSGDLLLDSVSTLSFWHYFETDATYDGGLVEITTDGGSHWTDLGPYMTQNGYNSNLFALTGNRQGFSGSSGGVFIQTLATLTGFAGKTARIRFRFASDPTVGGDGWYIDDILLKNEKGAISTANAFSGSTLLSSNTSVSLLAPGALPVNFLLFEVKKQGTAASLHWQVNGEMDVNKYIVQRSGDGVTFTPIGELPSGSNDNYTFIDPQPVNGANYYRIVEQDLDGKQTYSSIRLLQWNSSGWNIRLYPVPTYDHQVNVELEMEDNATVIATLTNTVGQTTNTYELKRGLNRLTLGQLPKGLYFLRIQTPNRPVEIRKVVID